MLKRSGRIWFCLPWVWKASKFGEPLSMIRLAAAVFFVQLDDCINLLFQQSLREYLPFRVNNALSFVVTQELINRPSVKLLHYGLHSLDAPSSVDKFKLSMGYSTRPVRQRVVFHPAVPRAAIPRLIKYCRQPANFFQRIIRCPRQRVS